MKMDYIKRLVILLVAILNSLHLSTSSSNQRRFLLDDGSAKQFRPLTDRCKASIADVVFLLDSTNKEGPTYFQKQKDLIVQFVKTFQIGPQNMQISVCTVSTSMFVEFSLNQYNNAQDIVQAVQKVPFRPGSSYGSFGIRSVGTYSFHQKHGDRPDAPNVLVVMTNGQSGSKYQIKPEARLLREAGVLVFAVGIGDNITTSTLHDIAFFPDRIITMSNSDSLSTYLNVLENALCDALNTTGKTITTTTTTPTTSTMTSSAAATTTTTTTTTTTAKSTTMTQTTLLSTTPSPCIDLTACSAYGSTICGQRPDFVRVACPLYCGLCTKSGSCVDTIDCTSLGPTVCGKAAQYARVACPAYCGFCT